MAIGEDECKRILSSGERKGYTTSEEDDDSIGETKFDGLSFLEFI